MLNIKNKKLLFLFIVCSVILFLANSGNPPDGHTGAPFDGLCSSCHGGGSYVGTVDISGFPTSILPNTNYSITLTITATSGTPVVGGFQLVSVDASNVNAGNLAAGSGSGTTTFNSRVYIDQRGSKLFSGGAVSWTFNWTSPSGPAGSVITMYYAGNMANGNGSTSGDKIIKSSKSGTLSGGNPLTLSIISKKNISCYGGSDGSVTASAGGGLPPYSYLWSNGKTTSTINNLSAGIFKVTVTDFSSATATATTSITQPDSFTIHTDIFQNPLCPTDSTGEIKLNVTGATPAYNYLWSSGESGNYITNKKTGSYTVTVSDSKNCSAEKTYQLKSSDTIAPNLVVKNSKVYLDSSGKSIPKLSDYVTKNTDNCDSLPTLSINIDTFRCNHLGKNKYIITSRDASGNKTKDSVEIEVLDTLNPKITCPTNINLSCVSKTDSTITGIPIASDNCNTQVMKFNHLDFLTKGSCNDNYIITRTWTATDSSNNMQTCSQIITVKDTTKPFITCPENKSINCESSISPANTGVATANDNCTNIVSNISYSDSIIKGSCHYNYLLLRNWMAMDSCGNASNCLQKINIQDTTKPKVFCPENLTLDCDVNVNPVRTGFASAHDNCTSIITDYQYSDSKIHGNCSHNDTITRIWIATDSCGNSSSCRQLLTIQDTTRPSINCPPDITIACESSMDLSHTGNASASDNCTAIVTDINYSDKRIDGTQSASYTILRNWMATDSCNNFNTCIQLITALDTVKPVIHVWNDTSFNKCDIKGPLIIATDNCLISDFHQTEGPDTGQIFKQGKNVLSYFAKDGSGNISIDSFAVNIISPLHFNIDSFYFNYCNGNTAFTIIKLSNEQNTGLNFSTKNENIHLINDSSVIVITHSPDSLDIKLSEQSGCETDYMNEIMYPGPLVKLDSVKIINTGSNNSGEIQLFLNGSIDSIACIDATSAMLVNRDGRNLQKGIYYILVYKDSCEFKFGPFEIQEASGTDNVNVFDLRIYPIPFSNDFRIVSNINLELHFLLINAEGKIILKGNFESIIDINARELNPGFYYLRCFNEKHSGTFKLIKI